MIIVSIKDLVADSFFEPKISANEAAAKRDFKLITTQPSDSLLYQRAEDFQMWKLGTWDNRTGTITMEPKLLEQGVKNDLRKQN
ncbi:nonstructural protein [Capybara microvirus Cap1_SP_121]|nr:nonstructural protein [Capybara microvirus Cap1_SP_121]